MGVLMIKEAIPQLQNFVMKFIKNKKLIKVLSIIIEIKT